MNSICNILICLLLTGSVLLSINSTAAKAPITSQYNTTTDTADVKPIKSVITCPNCGFKKEETVPADYCIIRYTCTHCHKSLTPKKGDCCVFCSYGTVKCPTGK